MTTPNATDAENKSYSLRNRTWHCVACVRDFYCPRRYRVHRALIHGDAWNEIFDE